MIKSGLYPLKADGHSAISEQGNLPQEGTCG